MTIEGKVWGTTRELVSNPFVSFHRAEVRAGYRCSRHRHERKWNGFFLESGVLSVRVFQPNGLQDVTVLTAGMFTAVGPGIDHRFECSKDAVLFEVYWPSALGDDIVRADQGGPLPVDGRFGEDLPPPPPPRWRR